jgi:hypothetical protein
VPGPERGPSGPRPPDKEPLPDPRIGTAKPRPVDPEVAKFGGRTVLDRTVESPERKAKTERLAPEIGRRAAERQARTEPPVRAARPDRQAPEPRARDRDGSRENRQR